MSNSSVHKKQWMDREKFHDLLQKSRELRPKAWYSGLLLLLAASTTTVGILLSLQHSILLWFFGQILFGISCLQWFVLMHECGHNTLFISRHLNLIFGHIASPFSAIPFLSWKGIHREHHIWAGWRDIDPTTTQTVPRELKPFERKLINFCWKNWIPLFSVAYRVNNYWNLKKISHHKGARLNCMVLLLVYIVTFLILGPLLFIKIFAVSFFIHLVISDPIMMSQHTHVRQEFAHGAHVKPMRTIDQIPYTRSLSFPEWFSRLVVFGFERHELHHAFPLVPGYRLIEFKIRSPNDFDGFHWMFAARRIPADVFIFSDRDKTGFDI